MVPFKIDLAGKTAVVTGGGGVLCSAFAKALAESGANVAILDLKLEAAQKVADEINANGGKAIGISANVLEKESLEAAKAIVDKTFGGCDILLNGAGGNHPKGNTGADMKFFDMPQDAIQFVFNLNLLGTIMPTQVFGKLFAEQGAGCVVNISSMAADRPLTRTVAYSAAKAGVTNFTQWMATHFNKEYSKNIRVNAIAPGFLITQQNYSLMIDESTGNPTPRGQDVLRNTPMDRFGDPEELVGGVIYLCSDAAKFVNGIVLPIDGGYSAFSGV